MSLAKIGMAYEILSLLNKAEKYYKKSIVMADKQCELIGNTPQALRDLFFIKKILLDFKANHKFFKNTINLSDDIIKTALQLYNLSPKSLQAIKDLLEAYQLRLTLEKKLNPNLEQVELLQKIADLEQQRQQLLNNS